MTRPFVVGLTGGIGSGKSAAADGFAALGASVIDTDVLAHTLTAPGGEAIPALRAAFGDAAITPEGALDRAAMRQRVFADPLERQRLEAILHPLIRAEADAQIRRLAGADFVSPPRLQNQLTAPHRGDVGLGRPGADFVSPPRSQNQLAAPHRGDVGLGRPGADFVAYVILVVPLLVESDGYRNRVDRILVVDCPEELQVARVMARSGLDEAEIRAIIAAQASRQARLAAADDVLRNDGSRDQLSSGIRALHDRYLDLARVRSDTSGIAERG